MLSAFHSWLLQRQQQTMRQVVGAWQLQVYRAELLRHALARLLHKTLVEAFGAWRDQTLQQLRRRSLLHVSACRYRLTSNNHAACMTFSCSRNEVL
jgi:hypothetical protein